MKCRALFTAVALTVGVLTDECLLDARGRRCEVDGAGMLIMRGRFAPPVLRGMLGAIVVIPAIGAVVLLELRF